MTNKAIWKLLIKVVYYRSWTMVVYDSCDYKQVDDNKVRWTPCNIVHPWKRKQNNKISDDEYWLLINWCHMQFILGFQDLIVVLATDFYSYCVFIYIQTEEIVCYKYKMELTYKKRCIAINTST